MTIRHLRIFVKVAECGTMSLAAEKLFISQPTVSQSIRELEEHYNERLFERLSKHLFITETGEHLLVFAREVIRQFDELEEQMAVEKQIPKIRIGASLTIGTCLLPETIGRYKKAYPQVEVFACVNNTKVVEEKLLNSELDMGLVEGQVKSHELVCDAVIEDELVMVCSNTHPFAGKQELNFAELQSQRFVLREKGSGTREMFEKDLEQHKINVKIAWEVMGTEAVKHAVIQDGCLSVISFRLVETEIRSGNMYMFRKKSNLWKRQFNLVYHKDKYINERMNFFIKSVEKAGYQDSLMDIQCGYIEEA